MVDLAFAAAFGEVEGFGGVGDAAPGFEEDEGLFGDLGAAHFDGVFEVVFADGDDFRGGFGDQFREPHVIGWIYLLFWRLEGWGYWGY